MDAETSLVEATDLIFNGFSHEMGLLQFCMNLTPGSRTQAACRLKETSCLMLTTCLAWLAKPQW